MDSPQEYYGQPNGAWQDCNFLDLSFIRTSSTVYELCYYVMESFFESFYCPSRKKRTVLSWFDVCETLIPLSHGILISIFLVVLITTLQLPTYISFDISLLCVMMGLWGCTALYDFWRKTFHEKKCFFHAVWSAPTPSTPLALGPEVSVDQETVTLGQEKWLEGGLCSTCCSADFVEMSTKESVVRDSSPLEASRSGPKEDQVDGGDTSRDVMDDEVEEMDQTIGVEFHEDHGYVFLSSEMEEKGCRIPDALVHVTHNECCSLSGCLCCEEKKGVTEMAGSPQTTGVCVKGLWPEDEEAIDAKPTETSVCVLMTPCVLSSHVHALLVDCTKEMQRTVMEWIGPGHTWSSVDPQESPSQRMVALLEEVRQRPCDVRGVDKEKSGCIHLNCMKLVKRFVEGMSVCVVQYRREAYWPEHCLEMSLLSSEVVLALGEMSEMWLGASRMKGPWSCVFLADDDTSSEEFQRRMKDHIKNLRICLGCAQTKDITGRLADLLIHCYLYLQCTKEALELFSFLFPRVTLGDAQQMKGSLDKLAKTSVVDSVVKVLFRHVFEWSQSVDGQDSFSLSVTRQFFDWFDTLPMQYLTRLFIQLISESESMGFALEFFKHLCQAVPHKLPQIHTAFFDACTRSPHMEALTSTGLPHVDFHWIHPSLLTERFNQLLWWAVQHLTMHWVFFFVDRLVHYHLPIRLETVLVLLKKLKPSSCRHDKTWILSLMDYTGLMQKKNCFPVVVNALMKLKELERLKVALDAFDESNVSPLDALTVGTFIKACGRCGELKRGWAIWCRHVHYSPHTPTTFTYSCVLDMLVSNNHIERAIQLLRHASCLNQKPTTVHYCIVIKGCSQQNKIIEALQLYSDMKKNHIHCNAITYNTLIHGCVVSGQLDAARCLVHHMMSSTRSKPDLITYSSIIKGLCNKRCFHAAFRMLQVMEDDDQIRPDVVTYNTLLEGCSTQGQPSMVQEVFQRMLQRGIAPTCFTLTILIKYYGKSKQLKHALYLAETLPRLYHFENDAYVYTALIATCLSCDELPSALMFFLQLNTGPYKNNISARTFATVSQGCLNAHCPFAAYAFIYEASCRKLTIDRDMALKVADALQRTVTSSLSLIHTLRWSPAALYQTILWLKKEKNNPYPFPAPLTLSTLQAIFQHFSLPSTAYPHLFSATLSRINR